jgi:hypothetical protein
LGSVTLALTQLGDTNSILVLAFWAARGDKNQKAAITDITIAVMMVKAFCFTNLTDLTDFLGA